MRGLCEELLSQRTNAALALNGLDENGADFMGKFSAKIGDIIEAHEFNAGDDGSERLAVFRLIGRLHGSKGTAVEALLQGRNFVPMFAPSLRFNPA